MKYQITWRHSAEQELAVAWLGADDRDVITRAAHAVDHRLQSNAPDEGESRPDGRRIIFELPLVAIFRVTEDTGSVDVLQIWVVD